MTLLRRRCQRGSSYACLSRWDMSGLHCRHTSMRCLHQPERRRSSGCNDSGAYRGFCEPVFVSLANAYGWVEK